MSDIPAVLPSGSTVAHADCRSGRLHDCIPPSCD
jgi:hypothetical protein